MTPRRYLATPTLTVENRNLPELAESQYDEIRALRNAYHAKCEEAEAYKRQRDELAELVRVRDEQLSGFNDKERSNGDVSV